MKSLIEQKLQAAFCPELLQVDNQSHLHRHHPMSPQGDDSHFHITMNAKSLIHLSLLEQHRRVYQALEEIFEKKVHALGLTINSQKPF